MRKGTADRAPYALSIGGANTIDFDVTIDGRPARLSNNGYRRALKDQEIANLAGAAIAVEPPVRVQTPENAENPPSTAMTKPVTN